MNDPTPTAQFINLTIPPGAGRHWEHGCALPSVVHMLGCDLNHHRCITEEQPREVLHNHRQHSADSTQLIHLLKALP